MKGILSMVEPRLLGQGGIILTAISLLLERMGKDSRPVMFVQGLGIGLAMVLPVYGFSRQKKNMSKRELPL